MNRDVDYQITEYLRDFFIADGAKAMEKAYLQLAEASINKFPQVDDFQEVEYSFNRLFVGPKALEAPPYASVYLQEEPNVMGETTMMARSVYEVLGLVSPWKNTLPDDHISLELDAAMVIHKLQRYKSVPDMTQLRDLFLEKHMLIWIPMFCMRIQNAPSCHEAISSVAEALKDWMDSGIATGAGLEQYK